MKISVIGIGRLGGALALALAEAGYEIENLITTNIENTEKITALINPRPKILSPTEIEKISSEIIFIAAQDFKIAEIAENLTENLRHQPTIFHTSGALSSESLENLREIGCQIGSFHPLVSISDSLLGKERFRTAFFCVEGDAKAVETAKNIVEDLGGKSFSVETKYKILYHASAVTACGHLVALIDMAIEMLSKCGLEESEAKNVLLPLIESTIENLKTQTTSEALTGTFARADFETFEKHLETLRENVSEEALEIYLNLGERSTHLAEREGANRKNLEKIRESILLAKKKLW
jgi:predicted short-subunit dehydrogenase-like oxidoreductase (DUF2520 family)